MSISWIAKKQIPPTSTIASSDNSSTFLTGINNEVDQQDEENDDEEEQHISLSKPNTSPSMNMKDENSMNFTIDHDHFQNNNNEDIKNKSLRKSASTPISTNIQQHPLLPLINSVSTLDLLKIRQNYSKIYTSR